MWCLFLPYPLNDLDVLVVHCSWERQKEGVWVVRQMYSVYSQLGFLQSAASSCDYHMFVITLTYYRVMEVSLYHSRGAVIEFTPLSQ